MDNKNRKEVIMTATTTKTNVDLALAYRKAIKHGNKSTRKLDVLHGQMTQLIAEAVSAKLGVREASRIDDDCIEVPGVKVASKLPNGSGKEKVLSTLVTSKSLDMYFENEMIKTKATCEVKFPLQNLAQNHHNMIENLIGISAIIDAHKDPICNTAALFVPINAPYFTSKKGFRRQEKIDMSAFVDEYARLMQYIPDKLPMATLIVFWEYVIPDDGKDMDLATRFELGEMDVRIVDAVDLGHDDLSNGLFIGDIDGFIDYLADTIVYKTPGEVSDEKVAIRENALQIYKAGMDLSLAA